jgi:type I restriction enzyme, S subunit
VSEHLPTGWKRVRVGDLAADIRYGHTASAANDERLLRFLRITDIQDGQVHWPSVPGCSTPPSDVAKYLLQDGDIVFARTGATTGKSYLLRKPPVKTIFASYLIRLRLSAGVDPRYIFWFFQTADYWRQIETKKRGIGQPGVNATSLAEVHLPLAPLEQQTSIVFEIEKHFTRLDAAVASLSQAQAKLKAYRRAILQAAFDGVLVPNQAGVARQPACETGAELLVRIGKERQRLWDNGLVPLLRGKRRRPYAQPVPTNVSSPLPSGWAWASWGQIGFSQNGRAFPSKEYQESGVRLLRPGNLFADASVQWTPNNTRCMPPEYEEQNPDLAVGANEIIMNLTAQSLKDEFLGRACMTASGDHCLLNQRLARLTPVLVEPRFILWFFKSPQFRRFVNGLNTGSLIQHMFTSQIDDLPVPLPPLAEQTRVVEEVERQMTLATTAEQALRTTLSKQPSLRESVLSAAFSGTLVGAQMLATS